MIDIDKKTKKKDDPKSITTFVLTKQFYMNFNCTIIIIRKEKIKQINFKSLFKLDDGNF